MSKSRRKTYSSKNKPSKRYIDTELYWDPSVYASGGFCRGHKTRHADNQSVNQQVRTQEKRKNKKFIRQEIQEYEDLCNSM